MSAPLSESNSAGTAREIRHAGIRLLIGRHPRRTLRRALGLAIACVGLFGGILRPVRVNGLSMEPTVRHGTLRFVLLPSYTFSHPKRGDVVVIRMGGRRVMYLKRILATAGDRIAFESGELRINGEPSPEPYVVHAGEWTMPELRVPEGEVFVAGDNRSEPMEQHAAGRVRLNRIAGEMWP
ncbi:MAG: signal peptidase I [Kiritimatiellia bacterium]|nr:signal peptidase I [Kiritimatiellia bacterium]